MSAVTQPKTFHEIQLTEWLALHHLPRQSGSIGSSIAFAFLQSTPGNAPKPCGGVRLRCSCIS
jgi:hypothetical protein